MTGQSLSTGSIDLDLPESTSEAQEHTQLDLHCDTSGSVLRLSVIQTETLSRPLKKARVCLRLSFTTVIISVASLTVSHFGTKQQ